MLSVTLCMSLAITLCFSTSIATALSEENLDKFAANNIMFYDPEDDNCKTNSSLVGMNITYIGDSLSEQVYGDMQAAYPGIDGEDKELDGTTYKLILHSKKFTDGSGDNHDGITIAAKLVEKMLMREFLIFALGTNLPSTVTNTALENLVTTVGDKTKILLVTPYKLNSPSDYTSAAERMRSFAATKGNVTVADWAAMASSDQDRYINNSDGLGVHLSPDGVTAFVDMLKTAMTNSWGGDGNGGSTATAGDNKNYDGQAVWTDSELQTIESQKAVYEAAAQKYGLKWQTLATLHSAEYGLRKSNPSNGQGLYQLYSYTGGGSNSNAFLPAGPITDEEFARQTDIAASVVVNMINSYGLDPQSDEGVKSLFFHYNGTASQYKNKALAMGFSQEEANWGEGSAYVMNRFDARRDPAHTETMDPNWPGRFVADGVYDSSSVSMNFGTFVKYAAIGGTSATGSSCSNTSNDLAGYILRYAWPEHHDAPYTDRMPDYADVVAERSSTGRGYIGGSVNGVPGIDCGGFVSTLLNESGFDPDYNTGSGYMSSVTYGQMPYIKDHPDQWEMVNSDWNSPISDEAQLTPGDVAFTHCSSTYLSNCGHTYVYAGTIEGFGSHIASASYSSTGDTYARAPMAGTEAIIKDGNGNPVRWFHKK